MNSVPAEDEWRVELARRDPPRLDTGGWRRAAVVSAHPDDESLGVSGLLQTLHEQGTRLDLIVATDGEAAFPALDDPGRRELADTRRRELHAAVAAYGINEPPVCWLGFPDSNVAPCEDELVEVLRPLLAEADVCLAPWSEDPHPDHQAVGRAVLRAAPPGARVWGYPIWAWHRMEGAASAFPWGRAATHALDPAQRERKAAGLAAFTSQTETGPDGADPILPADVLAHFDREHEVLFAQPRASTPRERFAELYESSTEPWDVHSWYERRKQRLAVACLPEPRYATALEPACGTGELTRLLASRCDRVLASDANGAAVERARAKLRDHPAVRFEKRSLPGSFGHEAVDLLVWSEILYYLGDDALTATITECLRALRPGGDVLAVHWRHRAHDAPHDGPEVHRRLGAHPDLLPVASYDDADFLVSVLRRR
ncbi:bifunctional PIG-L family deacetylase/class I SAM-dependent methyltransferase [Saccharopolyspora gloriosae]|uniref:bifunctional PIG-L family deacetylase/class I SAM-dependent methyltransferase n=1 Tax=Saccharopolyspora gloriosae TaxID=455344 RepID=UPI001FB83686|nr:bifunctional PIG-L family deacetylase/class I SAM-dependent methyltransferase [Saccharopolyspora gloriosae]